jgi:hypothetical protein
MSFNPLAPVTDYQSMLNRIYWFTSAAALGAVWLLRSQLPALDEVLGRVDFELQTSAGKLLPVPGGYLLPALGVGMFARVFRVSSHLGHWLGIRERFEIEVILAEFARRLGLDGSTIPDERWLEQRYDLMRKAFYRFASSQSPQIDVHLVHQALDLWSWFWIGLETAVVFVASGFVLIASHHYQVGTTTLAAALLLASLCLPLIRSQCRSYAIAQVRAILADAQRAAEVRQAFDSLCPRIAPHRLAA